MTKTSTVNLVLLGCICVTLASAVNVKLKIEEERQPSTYGEILAQQGQLNRVP